jgi:hypothetical protein
VTQIEQPYEAPHSRLSNIDAQLGVSRYGQSSGPKPMGRLCRSGVCRDRRTLRGVGSRHMRRGYRTAALIAAVWLAGAASARAQQAPAAQEPAPPKAASCAADARSLTDASGAQSDCSPYRCVASACLPRCVTQADCLEGYACTDGSCTVPAEAPLQPPAPAYAGVDAEQPTAEAENRGSIPSGVSFGGSFDLTLPQGELGKNIQRVGPGFSLWGVWSPSGWPVGFGCALGGVIYGSERRTEPFSTTIPDVRVDVKTDNTIFLVHPFVRLLPLKGTFRPYLDGWIGLKHFSTDTRIESRTVSNSNQVVAQDTNQSDTAFSYGGALGVQVAVGGRPAPGSASFMLDGGVRYLAGSEAEYLREGSIERVGSSLRYDTLRSTTNVLVIYLGVGLTGH